MPQVEALCGHSGQLLAPGSLMHPHCQPAAVHTPACFSHLRTKRSGGAVHESKPLKGVLLSLQKPQPSSSPLKGGTFIRRLFKGGRSKLNLQRSEAEKREDDDQRRCRNLDTDHKITTSRTFKERKDRVRNVFRQQETTHSETAEKEPSDNFQG